MKKTVRFVLVALLTLCLFGCGQQSPADTATTAPPLLAAEEGMEITELQNPGRYAPVTGPSQPLEGLPAYVCAEGQEIKYRGPKECRFDQVAHNFMDSDAASYITYLQALEADGWEQYSSNVIEGVNLFATYIKDGQSVYAYYIPEKSRTYILHSPTQNLEAREQDNQYEAICTPLLTQVKLICEDWNSGMSYVVRLSDGRFIIIDGGWAETDYREARRLYALLEEQNVLDKITIAAWVITHPHKDHLATTADFLRYYNPTQVELEQMILNFPSDQALLDTEPSQVNDVESPHKMPAFFIALETLWPQVPITVCHTGQEFYFADAKLEILHTHEDFYPQDIMMQSQDPVNGASVVFTLEVGGQKTLFLADSARDCSKDLVDMWGDYLKCDIMQAAHHGINGGTVELYETVDPKVALVPCSTQPLGRILSYPHSRWLWNNESGNIREVVLSGWEQRTFELPYTTPEGTPYFSAAADDPWAGLADKYQNP